MFICRRTCRNNIENVFKVYKEHSKTNIRHKPKGEKAHLLGRSGPKHVENKTKNEANHLEIGSTLIGPTKKPTRDHPPKLGSFGPS